MLGAMVPHPRGRWLLEEVRGRCTEEREQEKTEDDQRRREHDTKARNAALSRLARIGLEKPKTPRDQQAVQVPVAASSAAAPQAVRAPVEQQWPAVQQSPPRRSLRLSEPMPPPPRPPVAAAVLSNSDQSMRSRSADSDDDDHAALSVSASGR